MYVDIFVSVYKGLTVIGLYLIYLQAIFIRMSCPLIRSLYITLTIINHEYILHNIATWSVSLTACSSINMYCKRY